MRRKVTVYIEDFDWDDDNIAHIAQHGVEPEEVEEDRSRHGDGGLQMATDERLAERQPCAA